MTDRAMSDEIKPCVIWECIYDHGNGKFMGDASKAQRERAFAELRRLHAEVEALRADAERYRWLAAHCRSTSEHWGGRWSIIVDGPAPQSHDSEDDFDAAIDAARKESA